MQYQIEKNQKSTESQFNVEIPIFKVDEMKRIVYGRALVPEKIDKQDDIVTREEIENVAHDFMINMQKPFITDKDGNIRKSQAGYMHQVFGDNGLFIVESYIDKSDGSWCLGTYVENDIVWEKVLKKEITGYSIGGVGERVPILYEVEDDEE